ncbi:hypothetical protein IMCC26256_112343 [Actinobacteria bacterium IMCC26256]|nr:hypothetical protein IMCC26256_112343 [Actinobacteria bacterium IMCC26256]
MAEWSDQAVDTIEKVVVGIREKAVLPIERASRMIVFGVFVGILAICAFTLLLIALHRILSIALPAVWLAWMIEGVAISLLGYFVWRQRSRFAQGSSSD